MSDHRFFIDSTLTGAPVRELLAGDPAAASGDIRYAYDVLQVALTEIAGPPLHVYFTRDAYSLPEYGRHVVSVLVQEERCKCPVYGAQILATVKNLGSVPFIGFGPHARMGQLEAVLLFEYVRDWYTHVKSRMAQRRRLREATGRVRRHPVTIDIPLGYHSQADVPQRAMADRPLDVFFAGQVRHDLPVHDYRYWISTSKFVAREQLWDELKRLDETKRWSIDLGAIAGTEGHSRSSQFATYSQKMMSSRICVAPRGSVAESYRAYEGARAGCLVVTNRLPNTACLAEAPFIQVDHWRELAFVLERYARDLALLEEARAATLSWWNAHADVETVGLSVARGLAQASADLL